MYLITVAAAALLAAPGSAQDSEHSDDVLERIAVQCGMDRDLSTEELMSLPTEERQEYVSCGLQGMAVAFNQQLPQDDGNGDRIIAVSSVGTTFVMTIEASPNGENAAEARRKYWRIRTCGDEDGQSLIEVGGAYRFVWVDNAGAVIDEVMVDTCSNSGS